MSDDREHIREKARRDAQQGIFDPPKWPGLWTFREGERTPYEEVYGSKGKGRRRETGKDTRER